MNSKQTVALAVFTVVLLSSSCSSHEQKYCGRSLARAIAVLCYETAVDSIEKRSEGGMYNAILAPYYKDQEPQYNTQYGWGWPHKARVMSLPSRGKRFVVNECCDKPCTLNELMSYCDI